MGRGERVTFAGERIVNFDRGWCCVVYGIKSMYSEKIYKTASRTPTGRHYYS